jgi:hypothetical protein
VVLLVLAVIVVVATGGGASKRYMVGTPPSAGGLVLDRPADGIAGAAMTQQQAVARATGAKIQTMVAGFYKDPSSSSYLPVGVVFVGGTGDMGDPETFLRGRRPVTGSTAVTDTDAGGEGKGVCVMATGGSTATCMWATEHSFGMVTPTTPKSPAELGVLMRRMRPDLEQPK